MISSDQTCESARGGDHVLSACWRGNGPPRQRRVWGVRACPHSLGLRTAQTPTGGCSRESSAMGESLTERRRVRDEGLRVVNRCRRGGRSCEEQGLTDPRRKGRLISCQQPR